MNQEKLTQIKQRHERATPSEEIKYWRYDHGGGRATSDGLVLDAYEENDREFYFNAYDDIKFLLEELEKVIVPTAKARGLVPQRKHEPT